ncbi:hypothetical protein HRbin21_01474 [bacterium HR21]|nr:hypothetical protein HRbin21_01474 [bacterium HR21]
MAPIPLSEAPLHRPVIVAGYAGEDFAIERFRELGFTLGTVLVVRRRAPLGGSFEVECRGLRIGVRAEEAATIYVLIPNGNGSH